MINQHQSEAPAHPRLIYVIGNGHSGTTLLCLLLGANPHIFAGGHLRLYKKMYTEADTIRVSNGDVLRDSPLWNEVKQLLQERGQTPDFETPDFDAREMRAVYQAILDITGDSVICDNSMNIKQLNSLIAESIDTFIVHIVRDGRAVQHSMTRKYPDSNVWEIWRNYNLMIWNKYRGDRRYTCVRYEDLVRDPRQVTQRLLDRVAAFFGDERLRTLPEGDELFRFDNLMFDANRMRFKRDQRIVPDLEYLHTTSLYQWMRQTWVMAPALLRFGYPLLRRMPGKAPW